MNWAKPYLVFLAAAVLACGCQRPQLQRSTRVLMGTFVEVISPDPRAAGIVFAEIARIEALLSKYRPDSEVSRLNRDGWVKASPEMFYILEKSRGFWEMTGGVFDVTVGPLMDVWGFTARDFRVPAEERIKKAMELVGTNKIIFNKNDSVVKSMLSGMEIDLGAIAKGYAVDLAVAKLREAKVESCLINAGGQIYCLGTKNGKPWKVAIRDPRGRSPSEFLELQDQAVATSGGYEQYFEVSGKQYSHIMDPTTGHPVDSGVLSATVIAADGLTADALATAIVVLGKTKGRELVEKFPGARIKVIER